MSDDQALNPWAGWRELGSTIDAAELQRYRLPPIEVRAPVITGPIWYFPDMPPRAEPVAPAAPAAPEKDELRWRPHPFDEWRICTAHQLEVDGIDYHRYRATNHLRPMIELLRPFLQPSQEVGWHYSLGAWEMDYSKPPLTDAELDEWVMYGHPDDRF